MTLDYEAERVAEIAASLTKAQKGAVLSLTDEFAPPRRPVTRQAVAALAMHHRNICQLEFQHGCASMTYYRLTPLGLAVRSILTEKEKGE